jgi:hypothetical protein
MAFAYIAVSILIWLVFMVFIVKRHKAGDIMFDADVIMYPIMLSMIISAAWIVTLPVVSMLAFGYGVFKFLTKIIK